ncbi:MAG: hypothetical protein EOP83_28600 [Verrucomicrobiaceae bacterium]|nr:MAG: hypothetical protein EOP83_28600 [Verrucomicrobiaceae bacterium]
MTLDDGTELFKKADVEVRIAYWNDKASEVSYKRYMTARDVANKNPKEITETELTVLLDSNKGSSDWKKDEASDREVVRWQRADGGASAVHLVDLGVLTIKVAGYDDYRDRQKAKAEAEKAKKEAKKLDGF